MLFSKRFFFTFWHFALHWNFVINKLLLLALQHVKHPLYIIIPNCLALFNIKRKPAEFINKENRELHFGNFFFFFKLSYFLKTSKFMCVLLYFCMYVNIQIEKLRKYIKIKIKWDVVFLRTIITIITAIAQTTHSLG